MSFMYHTRILQPLDMFLTFGVDRINIVIPLILMLRTMCMVV